MNSNDYINDGGDDANDGEKPKNVNWKVNLKGQEDTPIKNQDTQDMIIKETYILFNILSKKLYYQINIKPHD